MPKGREQDSWKVTVRLRTLRVMREEPHHIDLEIFSEIAEPPTDLQKIWERHVPAFDIERVTQRFFDEYRNALYAMMDALQCDRAEPEDQTQHPARRFAFSQLFLNHLMVYYFLARKGWMRDDSGKPVRRYFRWLWKRYNE